ncbi:hypothetical protein [Undibacterium amnicola]|nr:hypothetical protein [Undibacterium amnicola]
MNTKIMSQVLLGIGILLSYYILMLRYGWYVDSEKAQFLTFCFFIFVALIFGLWLFFPSKILGGFFTTALFVIPPVFDEKIFVQLNKGFIPYIFVCVLLVVSSMYFRQGERRRTK